MHIWVFTKQTETEYENARLIQEFSELGANATLMNPNKFNIVVNKGKNIIKYNNKNVEDMPDSILIRTGSGTDYHALTILKEFEQRGIICLNSSNSTTLAKDKFLSGQLLTFNGISFPKTINVKFPIHNIHEYAKEVTAEIGFPCIIKVNTGSFGHGVHLCRLEEEFYSLIQLIQTIAPTCQIIIQKFISTKIGSDLRVWVIGGKVIGAMQRIAAQGDFRANISNGGIGEKYEINEKIEQISINSALALNLDFAGVDLLFDGDDFTVCEVNSSPGFAGFEKYCDENVARKIAEHVIQCVSNKNI